MSDLDPRSLRPGILDGSAERAFTAGACAALAIALHDATGWALVKVTDSHNVWVGDDHTMEGLDADARSRIGSAGGGSALHWMVVRPDGALIDVDGAHSAADVIDEHDGEADDGESALGQASRRDAVEEYEGQGEPISIRLAATFVTAVLARAGRWEQPSCPHPRKPSTLARAGR